MALARKLRIGILFGGKSAEHEVSLQSAKNVVDAIDRDRFEVVLIGIDKQGRWLLPQASTFLLHADDPKRICLNTADAEPVALVPESRGALTALVTGAEPAARPALDVVFPILHGPFGEDGTVQGLLKLAGVPFVGAGVLGSAVGMDKDVMKRLLREAGIPIAKFLVATPEQTPAYAEAVAELGEPLFVKPANLGSSVGVSKVADEAAYLAALETAFAYDRKVLIEEQIVGRELECAVLGNAVPRASGVGEIIPQHEFYSYEAKYVDAEGALLRVPAEIAEDTVADMQALAIRTFQVLAGEGLARVDCFLTPDGRLVVNEINTMPGFTKVSMYPQLWAASGLGYSELITELIELALERFEQERRLRVSYE